MLEGPNDFSQQYRSTLKVLKKGRSKKESGLRAQQGRLGYKTSLQLASFSFTADLPLFQAPN